MDAQIECLNCGENYPPVACRWRCPACGFKYTEYDGEPSRKISGRNFADKEIILREWCE